ncbi:hypothetical protein GCM10027034_33700 [Ramlibacter solisilvae]|uniref:spore coat protein U domain-containing protein n=1 Tax=Ramlibacter tataouinensis TaxID=94132 RepID=UPI00077804D6|nr:spore coat protein U domain-containing protein [Ramlibacter tataouinensis]
MIQRLLFRLAGFLMLMTVLQPAAAITCTAPTSSGFLIYYASGSTTSVQATFSVTCTRAAGDAATSVTYDVQAGNGNNPQGQNNQASLGAARLRYDVYRDSGCSNQWKGNQKISDTITWTAGSTGPITRTSSYWGCINTAQTPAASGTFTDSVSMTLSYPGGTTVTGNIPVSIFAPAQCTFTSAPGAIAMNYVALGPQVQRSTSFAVQCTNGMPYTVTTNVTEGVLMNLRYILSVSPTAANGTGAPQSFQITATIPANQADNCVTSTGCTQSATHQVIVTY